MKTAPFCLPLGAAVTCLLAGPSPLGAELLGHWTFDQNPDPSALSATRSAWTLNNKAAVAEFNWIGKGALKLSPEGSAEMPTLGAFQGGNARSFSVWIKLDSPTLPARAKAAIFSTGLPQKNERWEVRFDHGGKPALYVGIEDAGRFFYLPAGNFDTWHHLAVAQSGSSLTTLRLWWDGQSLADNGQKLASHSMNTSRKPLLLGTSVKPESGTDKREFPGALDDLGVWDHAITEGEVTLIHGLGRAGNFGLLWLEDARRLSEADTGTQASLNGQRWEKVSGLDGPLGKVVAPQRGKPGATIVTDGGKGAGLRLLGGG